jgi:hypothetical protein
MYARLTTTHFSPYRVDEAIGTVRNHVLPATQQQTGFRGLLMLVDRSTGKGITITFWEDVGDRHISGPNSKYYREAIGHIVPLLVEAPTVEDLEIAIQV